MIYSRRHYDALSNGPPDTAATIHARKIILAACAAARTDTEQNYGQLTPANVREAIAFQEKRIAFHRERLTLEARSA